MDSGNSGSLQSSSGGDEEYESRPDSNISSSFINNNPSNNQIINPVFDPLSNFFDPRSSNPNPLLNLDMVWSRNLRSDPPADLTALVSNFPGVQNIQQQQQTVIMGHDQQQNSSTGNRNSKKRPRASRRAPTTVLTTDTTNFRAMVQEFTGIPAPPFTPNSSSISFPRNARFDLFNPSPSQPFLLRPFPQKPTFLSSNFLNNPNPNPNQNQNQNQNNLVFNIQNMLQKQGGSSSSSNLEIPNQTLKMGTSILDEFGLSHETLSLTRSDHNHSHSHSHNNNNITNPSLHPPPPPSNWVGDGSRNESNNYSNGRPTYSTTATASANSSEFLADKAAENNITTARSEGMVESWICSSD